MKVRSLARHINPLPLFEWADAQADRRYRANYAIAWLRRHHPLSPTKAALVCELANIGSRER